MPGAKTWSLLSTYHRDMRVPKKKVSGRFSAGYGGGNDTLIPKIAVSGVSSIGDALVGIVKWDATKRVGCWRDFGS